MGCADVGYLESYHIKKLTKEQTRRLINREDALKLWHRADEMTEMILAGSKDYSWDDVKFVQSEARDLENKALGY
jgi:hypothetical protein